MHFTNFAHKSSEVVQKSTNCDVFLDAKEAYFRLGIAIARD